MNITHAVVLLLLSGPASAQSAAQQQALKLDADIIRTMTDAVFLSLTGRPVADEAPAAPDESASADGPDSRLSRPRALSLIYETLASYEYAQADAAGGKPQEAGAKLSSRRSADRKAAASLERVRSRLHASKAAPVESGRSVAVGNKRLAGLNKTLGDLNAKLQDSAATPASKAALHAKIGKVYEQMSAAARYQASVAVVTGSVLDDESAAIPAAPAAPDSNQIARKSAKPAAKAAVKAAAKPAARAKSKIADDAAPAAADAPAPDASPASDEDAAAAGTSELNDMSSKMHDRIQSTKFEDPKPK